MCPVAAGDDEKLRKTFSRNVEQNHYEPLTDCINISRRSEHSQESKAPRQQFFCCDLGLRPFDPKINVFPGLIVGRLDGKLAFLAASIF